MSDKDNPDLFEQERRAQSALLDELDSLKALLDAGSSAGAPPTTVNEIRTVEEYMRLKQEADSAGISLDAYLRQRASRQTETAPAEIPMLEDVVEIAAGELPDGEPDIPTLEEVVEPPATQSAESPAAPLPGFTLEEIERIVEHIVAQRLQELKPQLEKQLFEQIRNMLPLERFK